MPLVSLMHLFHCFCCSLLRRFHPSSHSLLMQMDLWWPAIHSWPPLLADLVIVVKWWGGVICYWSQLPSPHINAFFFPPAGDSPFAASLLEALNNTVLNVFFLIWNVVSQVPSVRVLLTTVLRRCLVSLLRTFTWFIICFLLNKRLAVFMHMQTSDPIMIFEYLLLLSLQICRMSRRRVAERSAGESSGRASKLLCPGISGNNAKRAGPFVLGERPEGTEWKV